MFNSKIHGFTPDLEDYSRKTSRQEPCAIMTADNKNKTLASFSPIPHVHEDTDRKGSCTNDLHKFPFSEGVHNTSKLGKVVLYQNPYDAPSGMPSREGDKLSSE